MQSKIFLKAVHKHQLHKNNRHHLLNKAKAPKTKRYTYHKKLQCLRKKMSNKLRQIILIKLVWFGIVQTYSLTKLTKSVKDQLKHLNRVDLIRKISLHQCEKRTRNERRRLIQTRWSRTSSKIIISINWASSEKQNLRQIQESALILAYSKMPQKERVIIMDSWRSPKVHWRKPWWR